MKTATFKTPLGMAKIWGDSGGVSKIQILEDVFPNVEEVPEELRNDVDQLKKYFSGNLRKFDLKLNPSGTEFQKKVWKALCEIPFGTTCSYHQLSKELGDIKAIRAVAGANSRNPLWIVIPCHRVIGSDGSLTGYAGGLWRKKWLLEHENPTLQQTLF